MIERGDERKTKKFISGDTREGHHLKDVLDNDNHSQKMTDHYETLIMCLYNHLA